MTISRVNSAGWVDGQTVTAAQINQLDTNHASIVDGANGGTYAGNLTIRNLTIADGETNGGRVKFNSRTVVRAYANEMYGVAFSVNSYLNVTQTSFDTWVIPVKVPDGALIREIRVTFQPQAGHTGTDILGTDVIAPSFTFFSVDMANTYTAIGTGSDPSTGTVTASSYESAHDIVYTPGGSVAVDNKTKRYGISISGETGNGPTGLTIYGATIDFDPYGTGSNAAGLDEDRG